MFSKNNCQCEMLFEKEYKNNSKLKIENNIEYHIKYVITYKKNSINFNLKTVNNKIIAYVLTYNKIKTDTLKTLLEKITGLKPNSYSIKNHDVISIINKYLLKTDGITFFTSKTYNEHVDFSYCFLFGLKFNYCFKVSTYEKLIKTIKKINMIIMFVEDNIEKLKKLKSLLYEKSTSITFTSLLYLKKVINNLDIDKLDSILANIDSSNINNFRNKINKIVKLKKPYIFTTTDKSVSIHINSYLKKSNMNDSRYNFSFAEIFKSKYTLDNQVSSFILAYFQMINEMQKFNIFIEEIELVNL